MTGGRRDGALRLRLLLATTSRGKAAEYRRLFADLPVQMVTPDEIGITTTVEESGSTFEENARLKAVTLAAESGLPTLAEFLESTQCRDLQVGVGDISLIVQENIDFAVTFQTGNGVY